MGKQERDTPSRSGADRHSYGDGVTATFYLETAGDLREVADGIAELESTAKWMDQSTEPTELFKSCRGQVVEVQETGPGKGTVKLYFPLKNFDLEGAAFASVWLTLIGGGTFALVSYEKSRLVDFELPREALKYFPGPGFGIEGTRRFLGLGPEDVMIGTIVKPTSGLTPKQVADLCYEAARAGVVYIKDDEKMLNPDYCPLGERVKLVSKALKTAQEETGQKVLYTPHITAGLRKLKENARIALENGAGGLMVNFFSIGFAGLEMLRTDPEINVPIYAHCGGREAMGRVPDQGVSPVVIAKFARLMGGDYFRTGILGSYLVGSEEEFRQMNQALQTPMPGIKDAVPALSGGLNATNIAANIRAFGKDVLVLAGSGIFSHPKGPRAGVEEMKRAAAAV